MDAVVDAAGAVVDAATITTNVATVEIAMATGPHRRSLRPSDKIPVLVHPNRKSPKQIMVVVRTEPTITDVAVGAEEAEETGPLAQTKFSL